MFSYLDTVLCAPQMITLKEYVNVILASVSGYGFTLDEKVNK